MVLTFRKFLMMLDNSVKSPFFKNKQHRGLQDGIQKKSSCIAAYGSSSAYSKDIDFDQFDSEYWPHLNSTLTKSLDSSTVFTEIMCVIKGSTQAVKSPDGILSKASYVSSATSTKEIKFDATKRESIYSLFLQYEKLKKKARSYDIADQVRHLYKQLCHGAYFGDLIDFFYIDEVQDFTQAQLSLFSFVSSNIKDGFVFAGDTAQVITRGVDFRFQDAQSLFYTDFAKATGRLEDSVESVSNKKKSAMCTKEFAPTFFQLKHNFRTHMGVVNIANSIVELLYNFFPRSIDKLDQETSLVCGEAPVFLKAQGQEFVKMLFGSSGDKQRDRHEFGAHQVILVRDEDQKKYLVDQIGLKGLVLTISGCKGLEFEDVLIYNFFSGSSSLQNKWRFIYEYMYQSKAGRTDTLKMDSHPAFDSIKHNLLCSELKHLYVAITRARQRLWIYEENDEFCKPMLDYWMLSELVETRVLDKSFVSAMTASSTSEDWKKKGFKLFNQGQYDMAILCFKRAGDEQHTKLAMAANHQQAGEKQLVKNRKVAIESLREAARLFLSLGRAEMAAKCFIKAGDFQKAGSTKLKNCKPPNPKIEDAGDCFKEAKNWI